MTKYPLWEWKKQALSLQILGGSFISDLLLMGQLKTDTWQSESPILEDAINYFLLNRVIESSGLLFIFYLGTGLAHLKHDPYYKLDLPLKRNLGAQ